MLGVAGSRLVRGRDLAACLALQLGQFYGVESKLACQGCAIFQALSL